MTRRRDYSNQFRNSIVLRMITRVSCENYSTRLNRLTEAASAYRQALPLVSRLKDREEVEEIYKNLSELIQSQAFGVHPESETVRLK